MNAPAFTYTLTKHYPKTQLELSFSAGLAVSIVNSGMVRVVRESRPTCSYSLREYKLAVSELSHVPSEEEYVADVVSEGSAEWLQCPLRAKVNIINESAYDAVQTKAIERAKLAKAAAAVYSAATVATLKNICRTNKELFKGFSKATKKADLVAFMISREFAGYKL